MAARTRRGSDTKKRKSSSPKAARKSTLGSARANKLAAFGFTGFLVLMAGAAAIALDIPAKAALQAGEAIGSAGFRVDGYQIVGIKQMDRKLIDAVVVDELRRSAAVAGETKPAQPLVDVAANSRAAAAIRLDQGRARLAPPSRYSRHRHRRADAFGPVAGPATGWR